MTINKPWAQSGQQKVATIIVPASLSLTRLVAWTSAEVGYATTSAKNNPCLNPKTNDRTTVVLSCCSESIHVWQENKKYIYLVWFHRMLTVAYENSRRRSHLNSEGGEDLLGRSNGLLNILLCVRQRGEARLILRWCKVDALAMQQNLEADWTSTRLRVGRGYQVDKTTRDLRRLLVSQVPFFFLPWSQMIQSKLNVKSQRALTLLNQIHKHAILSKSLCVFVPAPSAASCGATWQTSLCRSW